jgi:hypothetical protein
VTAPDRTDAWWTRKFGLLRAIHLKTTADKAGKRETESEIGNVPYLNLEVTWQHVIAMHRFLLVALWELRCYN